jgi:hypothetical protein
MDGSTDPLALFQELTRLGPVRVVMRSCAGAVELLCNCDDIVVTPNWLYVGSGSARLQLHVPVLTGASFHDGGEAHPQRASLRLYGRCGAACLVLVFDRADGVTRTRQDASIRGLRARYGTRVTFAAAPAGPEHTVH